MPATAPAWDGDGADRSTSITQRDAHLQDAYWQRRYSREGYFRPGFDYEDYAPAYCVGYAGWAQYGGSFAEAERSLWANWERIKGGSRLSLREALPAMQAAWNRMAYLQARRSRPAINLWAFAAGRPRSLASNPSRGAAIALHA